jgi:hypothetical protein
MQGIVASAQAAFTLILMLIVGWSLVFIVGSIVERKVRGKRAGGGFWSAFTWVWDNANLIGIPTLIVGALYILWAFNYGPQMGGPTVLIMLLMGAAALLIGFAPSLRRR